MHGSRSASTADTIPHNLFIFSSYDLSEMIFLCIFTLFKNEVKKHSMCMCMMRVEVIAAYMCVPMYQNTSGKSKYGNISLDSVFFKMLCFISSLLHSSCFSLSIIFISCP